MLIFAIIYCFFSLLLVKLALDKYAREIEVRMSRQHRADFWIGLLLRQMEEPQHRRSQLVKNPLNLFYFAILFHLLFLKFFFNFFEKLSSKTNLFLLLQLFIKSIRIFFEKFFLIYIFQC